MFHAQRYRYRMEKGLNRVIGFIDQLGSKYGEGDERLRLYKIAAKRILGLRPAIITREIARWHSKFIRQEYGFPDLNEKVVKEHREQLPEIHRKTVVAFSRFQKFLTDW